MSKQVITINRTYGSNGRLIGKALSERLNIPFYDKELIELVSQECNIPAKELEKVDEKRANQWHLPLKEAMQMEPQYHFRPMNDVLFDAQSTVIRDLAEKEDCIIVGRCADYALHNHEKCLNVFIHADKDVRIAEVCKRMDISVNKAKDMIQKQDKQRASYYNYYSNKKWGAAESYNICLDSSLLGIDGTAKAIEQLVELKENITDKKL